MVGANDENNRNGEDSVFETNRIEDGHNILVLHLNKAEEFV